MMGTDHRSRTSVLGIGELLWDLRPDGAAIGGAPFNATAWLSDLGYRTAYATAVGRDELGDAAVRELRARGIETCLVARTDGIPTGVAHVQVQADGSPTFELVSPAAYEALALDDVTLETIVEADPAIVVIGTLAHRSPGLLESTRRLLTRLPDAICVYDVNLREGCWSQELIVILAELATVLKLSGGEAETFARVLGARWRGVEHFCRDIAARFALRAVAVTDGPRQTALLFDDVFATRPPEPVQVVDSIGSGDAFTAGLADGVFRRLQPDALLGWANGLGGRAASIPGALPDRRKPTTTEAQSR
jgi:fructokinase